MLEHGVKNNQQLAHAGGEPTFGGFCRRRKES
jgi:hypothetical protein